MSIRQDLDQPKDRYIRMTAKHDGECEECEGDIEEGDEIIWDIEEYKAYCEACGEDLM